MIISSLVPALRRARSLAVGALSLVASFAYADSISPTSYSASLGIGESVTITKTVTVTKAPPTSALIDIMFVFDITGSMGGAIGNAKTSAAGLLASLSAFGDVSSGTGWYADPTFNGVKTNLTTTAATTVGAINSLDACNSGSGFDVNLCGGDTPEKMYAAVVDTAQSASWRAGSNRFIVVLGDAANKPPPDAATTSAALAAADASVIGINFGNIGSSISAIGGTTYAGGTSPASIAAAILAGITDSFASYSRVTVDDLGGGLPGIDVTSVCTGADIGSCSGSDAVGAYDRSVDRTFTFATTFKRLAGSGPDVFDTYAIVDKGIVARERDTFTGGTVPEPGSLALVAAALLGLGASRRRAAA